MSNTQTRGGAPTAGRPPAPGGDGPCQSRAAHGIEILAPAGGMESLRAAVACGADAVYLGLNSLNARRGAENFSEAALAEAAAYCAARGVDIHLALNTLVFDDELGAAADCLRAACAAGVDAVIVQDLGVARLARACAPGLKLHASTQMSVHSLEGVEVLARLGFSRVVLARELSLAEIRHISKNSPIETEVFCHGALCMCLSGQCYLSSLLGGRSGNRGMCAQPCRLPFSGGHGNGHALSLKDLSLLTPGQVAALREAGVASLKIEGRMKGPAYVAAAVTAACQAAAGRAPDEGLLRAAFSRDGFTDGYFTGRLGGGMFGARGRADVLAGQAAQKPLARLAQGEPARVKVNFALTLERDKPATLQARDEAGNAATACGAVPSPARTRPTGEMEVLRSLQKLGGTYFTLGQVSARVEGGLALPAAALNALRREALEALTALRARPHPHPFLAPGKALLRPGAPHAGAGGGAALCAALGSAAQFSPRLADGCALVALYPGELKRLLESGAARGYLDKLAVRQPPLSCAPGELGRLLAPLRQRGIGTLVAGGLSGIGVGEALGLALVGNASLNITNTRALEEYAALGLAACTVSFELSARRIARLGGDIPRGLVAYGSLPLMTMRACPLRHTLGCARCKGRGSLKDRQGRRLRVSCRSGAPQLFNPDTLYLGERLGEFPGIDFAWLLFGDETGEEALAVLEQYRRGAPAPTMQGRTRGLYFRKVQ